MIGMSKDLQHKGDDSASPIRVPKTLLIVEGDERQLKALNELWVGMAAYESFTARRNPATAYTCREACMAV